jgi:hypothetical protein
MIKLHKIPHGYAHWCPGCEEPHIIPFGWSFDGNMECPTFNPSVRITGVLGVNRDGRWTGEWVRDALGDPVPHCCHYFVHGGQIVFCGDSTHAYAGMTLPLTEFSLDLLD